MEIMEKFNTRIVLRNDSSVNWLANESAILFRGEIGIEFFDNGKVKFKIGDGISPWSKLGYFGGELKSDNKSITVINEALQLAGFESASIGALPIKNSDGTLSWLLADDLLSDIKSKLSSVEASVEGLKTTIGKDATAETEATGLYAIVNRKIDADKVYTKDEVNALVGGAYRYRGSVEKFTDLPKEGQVVGDVWNIENSDIAHNIKAGDNVAWNGTSWDRLAGTIDLSGYVTHEDFAPVKEAVEKIPELYLTKKHAAAVYSGIRYEITNKPVDTLVDYRDKEIRIMCPANTQWVKQNVGPTGNSNNYYIGFKIYAPSEDVVSFKEDMNAVITDNTMHYYENNSFAGIDAYGRKYSIIWLAVALYDEATNTWTYYGKNSSNKRYIGWTYSVEWYNADGVKVASDSIRINLTNEACHTSLEPYYMNSVVKGVKLNGTLLDVIDNIVTIDIDVPVIKSSLEENKIFLAEDGTMEVNSLNVNKLTQTAGEWIILYGGCSSD
jgi:hypothetical protein